MSFLFNQKICPLAYSLGQHVVNTNLLGESFAILPRHGIATISHVSALREVDNAQNKEDNNEGGPSNSDNTLEASFAWGGHCRNICFANLTMA